MAYSTSAMWGLCLILTCTLSFESSLSLLIILRPLHVIAIILSLIEESSFWILLAERLWLFQAWRNREDLLIFKHRGILYGAKLINSFRVFIHIDGWGIIRQVFYWIMANIHCILSLLSWGIESIHHPKFLVILTLQ